MIRIIGMVIGIFCTATVLTCVVGFAYLSHQGNLTKDSLHEIRLILNGKPHGLLEEELNQKHDVPSYQDVVTERTKSILNISARESELEIIKKAIEDQTNIVFNERKQLEQLRQSFRTELTQEREAIVSSSATQARGILLKMDPENAVKKLLAMEPSEAVILIKGMQEKDSAKLLDQFSSSGRWCQHRRAAT